MFKVEGTLIPWISVIPWRSTVIHVLIYLLYLIDTVNYFFEFVFFFSVLGLN